MHETLSRRPTLGLVITAVTFWGAVLSAANVRADDWKAGVAKVVITPEKPIWMSGYAGRRSPAQGKLTDLWAKALVLEDARGERVAAVTLDLVGIDRGTSQEICDKLREKFGLQRRQVALFCSHTHTGPVVSRNLAAMYFLNEDQWQDIDAYTAELKRKVVAVVERAIDGLGPAKVFRGNGQATFAVNRRTNREADVPQLREQGLLQGPVDHDVPVLKVERNGKLAAVLFGYACHATVLSFLEWSGDYPGFAQIELEKSHPGTVAMFFAGCGADQNPLPRRKVELAQEYGRRLAKAVDAVLAGDTMQPVTGRLTSVYEELNLAFDMLPTREQIEQDAHSENRYLARRAKLLLERLDRDGELQQTYPYPVQSWRLGSQCRLITLGGEVVVDYSLRLKRELGTDSTWVAGYANDVMAYIPSVRVLKEGGYEGGGAMVYYGQPTVWSPAVEESIVEAVHKQAEQLRASRKETLPKSLREQGLP